LRVTNNDVRKASQHLPEEGRAMAHEHGSMTKSHPVSAVVDEIIGGQVCLRMPMIPTLDGVETGSTFELCVIDDETGEPIGPSSLARVITVDRDQIIFDITRVAIPSALSVGGQLSVIVTSKGLDAGEDQEHRSVQMVAA